MAEEILLTFEDMMELVRRLSFFLKREDLNRVIEEFRLLAAEFPRNIVENILNTRLESTVAQRIISTFGRKRKIPHNLIIASLQNLRINVAIIKQIDGDLKNKIRERARGIRINKKVELRTSSLKDAIEKCFERKPEIAESVKIYFNNFIRELTVKEKMAEVYPVRTKRVVQQKDLFQVAMEGAELEIFRTPMKVRYKEVRELPSWAKRAKERLKRRIRRR